MVLGTLLCTILPIQVKDLVMSSIQNVPDDVLSLNVFLYFHSDSHLGSYAGVREVNILSLLKGNSNFEFQAKNT